MGYLVVVPTTSPLLLNEKKILPDTVSCHVTMSYQMSFKSEFWKHLLCMTDRVAC